MLFMVVVLQMLFQLSFQRRTPNAKAFDRIRARSKTNSSMPLANLLLAQTASHNVGLETKCGSLRCQKDSYQKKLLTHVTSCSPSNGKKEKGNIWEVKLQDTVLFPEGGGQPWDLGRIGNANVIRVLNIDGEAVHFVDAELEVGSQVEARVDWARREDHMQQHSAQHLITAVAIDMYGFDTVAWNLKPDGLASTLDLDAEELNSAQLKALEQRCNQAIAEEHIVTPRWISHDSEEVSKIRCRGLPDGVTGPLRVLEIDGIDTNLCCGTHVKNLAHLRQIKLLQVERIRAKGRTYSRIHFVAGARLLRLFEESFTRDLQLNALLNAKPESHAEVVENLANTKREQMKEIKGLLAEVMVFTVERLKERVARGEKVVDVHRESGDTDFMRGLAAAMEDSGALLLTTIGCQSGTFMLSGPSDLVADLGPQVAKLLAGRGGGKGNYQGKADNLSGRSDAVNLLREAVEEK